LPEFAPIQAPRLTSDPTIVTMPTPPATRYGRIGACLPETHDRAVEADENRRKHRY
jgi:hypothetical protein